MAQKVSHTIRFNPETKARIHELSELKNRPFQAQVEHMLEAQMKNQQIVLFLATVECYLSGLPENQRREAMAKIASSIGMEHKK